MKKILAAALCTLLLVVGTGCSGRAASEQNTGSAPTAEPSAEVAPTVTPTEAAASETEGTEQASKETSAEKVNAAVVYFSGTGNTRKIAQALAQSADAALYEITPAEPYTEDDLNYSNDSCRANLEQNDDAARPDIAGDLHEAESCETVYLGYPIWWGTNPKIIETFLDSYALSAANVYLFCTSGGSGIETSVGHLQTQYPNVNIIAGHRFTAGASDSEIEAWLNELG